MFTNRLLKPSWLELLLGWVPGDPNRCFDFPGKSARDNRAYKPVVYAGNAPLITFAPSTMDRCRCVLIPNALVYPCPLITMDLYGKQTRVVARQRECLGQEALILDPFHAVSPKTARLNPFDLMDLPGSNCDHDAELITSWLGGDHHCPIDPYLSHMGTGLVSGLIAHIATTSPPQSRHLGQLRAWLHHSDLDAAITRLLASGSVKSRLAYERFTAYLAVSAHEPRPRIRTLACTYVSALGSDNVRQSLQQSSFQLLEVMEGNPLSIFIVLSPDKPESQSLSRLFVGTLLTALTRRQSIPDQRTLFLIDDAARLGSLPALRQALTRPQGSGLQVWTNWNDLNQLRRHYPHDWQEMVNNAGALQVFGINNHMMAREWAELVGMDPAELLCLDSSEALIKLQGKGSQICRLPDYTGDDFFAGLFDADERYAFRADATSYAAGRRSLTARSE